MKTKWKEQELTMSYHQFTLFQKGQPKPHHDWSDEDCVKILRNLTVARDRA